MRLTGFERREGTRGGVLRGVVSNAAALCLVNFGGESTSVIAESPYAETDRLRFDPFRRFCFELGPDGATI